VSVGYVRCSCLLNMSVTPHFRWIPPLKLVHSSSSSPSHVLSLPRLLSLPSPALSPLACSLSPRLLSLPSPALHTLYLSPPSTRTHTPFHQHAHTHPSTNTHPFHQHASLPLCSSSNWRTLFASAALIPLPRHSK
jgi:hypothetical protein